MTNTGDAAVSALFDMASDKIAELGQIRDRLTTENADLRAALADEQKTSSALLEALEAVMPILDRAESNASGNPEFDHVGPRVAAARAAIALARGAK